MWARSLYVRVMRAARAVLRATGLLGRMERSRRPFVRHLRTLLAIYDAEDLAALDLPWWSYASIEAVERFLAGRDDARVFEFGAGASTVWLARRVTSIVSVEHDASYLEVVERLIAGYDHATLRLVPPERPSEGQTPRVTSERKGFEGLDFEDYVASIDDAAGPFDLIVIDGRARVACLRRALPHLADDGVIVFDDVHRRRYAPALHHPELDAEVLHGRTPALPTATSTALLRRRTT